MLYRLGWLLYWIGSVIAIAFCMAVFLRLFVVLSGGVSNWSDFLDPFAPLGHTLPTPPQSIFFAIVAWAVGRAARYVLSGD
jgi:hypothetical protein